MEKSITIMTGIPYLKHFQPYKGIFANVQSHMMTFKKQLLSYVDSEDDNSYAARFNEEARENSSGKFTEEQLIASLFDFFTGGSGTMSKTLSFAILYLLHYPEMEEKIRSETSAIDGNRKEKMQFDTVFENCPKSLIFLTLRHFKVIFNHYDFR